MFDDDEVVFEDAEDPVFEVGDRVGFECGDLQLNRPRWQFNDDLGSSGQWASGVVTYIDDNIIQVEYEIVGYIGRGHSTWPNFNHEDYDPQQWWQDGYLMLLEKCPKCECGAEKTYGIHTSHVHWCLKFQ